MKKGYIFSIISAVLFGIAGLFVNLAYAQGLNEINILTLQYTIAVLIMFIFSLFYAKECLKINKSNLMNLIILGCVGNIFMTVFYYKAFKYLNVALVTMLLYTSPLMVFLYTVITKKEAITLKKIMALFLAFIGCILTLDLFNGHNNYSMTGIIFGLLSALFYAFMNIFSEKKLKEVSSLTINFYSTFFSLLCLYAYIQPYNMLKLNISIKAWYYIIILALFCEIIPLTLLYSSIKSIGSLKVSVIGNLEVPTAMLITFVLGQNINFSQIVGSVIIVLSVYIIKS